MKTVWRWLQPPANRLSSPDSLLTAENTRNFHLESESLGWQLQLTANVPTVQGHFSKSQNRYLIREITGEAFPCYMVRAGRDWQVTLKLICHVTFNTNVWFPKLLVIVLSVDGFEALACVSMAGLRHNPTSTNFYRNKLGQKCREPKETRAMSNTSDLDFWLVPIILAFD